MCGGTLGVEVDFVVLVLERDIAVFDLTTYIFGSVFFLCRSSIGLFGERGPGWVFFLALVFSGLVFLLEAV